MEQAIIVERDANGWVVRSAAFANEMFFRSGEHAEFAARGMAARMARVETTVVVDIFLRDGSHGGRYVHRRRARLGRAGSGLDPAPRGPSPGTGPVPPG